MARPTDICKLCLEKKLLEDSHFLPKSLYGYCRGENGLDPIKFSSEFASPTSLQAHAYLLCGECEDVLNEGGEDWMCSKLAKYEGTFPLYDLVVSGPAIFAEDDWAVYAGARNPTIDVNKIIHFAMGIYWKASVHSWRGGEDEPRIELGPYSEKIRQFLLGAMFPENVALAVVLSTPKDAYIGFNDPYEAVRDGAGRGFMFCVPGIWFMLSVGKNITPESVALSITSAENPIMISAKIAAKGQETAFTLFQGARKTKAFAKSMEKVRQAKGRGSKS